jgi:hypothetical protein
MKKTSKQQKIGYGIEAFLENNIFASILSQKSMFRNDPLSCQK